VPVVVVLVVALVTVHLPPERPAQALRFGVALTQRAADPWNPRAATDRATRTLARVAHTANQHIMGWGALNPSPRPGERQWDSLDERMRLIEAAGVEPVITLCCAPDWMKGGEPGETDWNRIEVAPDPAHYGDFAELAVDVARRYPQVRHYVVWNELKGFFDPQRGRWDIESYTELYDTVYRALKEHDPMLEVGGPYVVMDSWSDADTASDPSSVSGPWGVLDQRALDAVDHWLTHAAGADFLAVDGSNGTEDEGLIVEPRLANEKFTAATRWLVSRTDLPVWWMELYPDVTATDDVASPYAADVAADAILRVADAGGEAVFIWQPEADPGFHSVALWESTAQSHGGQPTVLAGRLEEIERMWGAGQVVRHEWRDGRLVLAPAESTT
jgi:hypothetical protein